MFTMSTHDQAIQDLSSVGSRSLDDISPHPYPESARPQLWDPLGVTVVEAGSIKIGSIKIEEVTVFCALLSPADKAVIGC